MVLTTSLLEDIRDNTKTRLETDFTHGAIASDASAEAPSDTELSDEFFRDTIDDFDSSVENAITASIRLTATEGNGNVIRKTGWLNAAVAGTLWTSNEVTDLNKTDDIQVFLDTTITISVTEA